MKTASLCLLFSAVSATNLRGWPNNRAGDDDPCNGAGYYTVYKNGQTETICMGGPRLGPSIPEVPFDPNRGQGGGTQPVPINSPGKGTAGVSVEVVGPSPTLPIGNGNCATENWNLEGSGREFRCSSNDDCKYGCCGTGMAAGKCISPFINPSFVSFIGCMPEFSACEVNRGGLPAPPSGPTTEPELAFGIDVCQPGAKVSGRVTECCSSSADCQAYGYVNACCDEHRLQCVPDDVTSDVRVNLKCLY